MINTANNKKGKGTSLSRQRMAIIVIALCLVVLAVALVVVNFITAQRAFSVDGEEGVKYYIIRQKDEEGKISFYLADADREPLETTEDGYFVTASGVLVAIDQTTGLGKIYARPATDGNEQLGTNDRILIFPYTKRAQAQSISVFNGNGEFSFYRRRIYVDTDHATYTCLYTNGKYILVAQEDPNDPESEFIEYKRGADGYYTLKSGNKISVNARTGAIGSVAYYDFDGALYTVEKNADGKHVLCRADGSEVGETITRSGERHDKDGNAYTATLYNYYVTDYGTLIAVDESFGVISAWSVREYNPTTKKYSTYHFLRRDGKYVLADADGKLITDTAIDDKDFYSTENHAYIAFDEATGSYKVRIQKNYYLIANNDGVYSLYSKDVILTPNSSGYYALPDGQSFIYFDAASGSFSTFRLNGNSYEELGTKYLNSVSDTNLEGEFVIAGKEEVEYDPALFAALITNGGYPLTPAGGKLLSPEKNPDGSINYASYGLIECDRVNASGETYHHVPSYYVFTDLEGNVHKIIIGDKIASNGGFYVRYEGVNATDAEMDALDKGEESSENAFSHNAVYILLDTYSMGFTTSYETFYYYSISDTFLAPIEKLVTPLVVPPTSTTTYFDVKNFIISTLNYDKLHEDILEGNDVVDGDYRDVWVNFTYYDIEERKNTVNASRPYVMGECELYGYQVNDGNVNECLLALMDLKCKSTQKISPEYSDFVRYGLDEPEYILYYELTATGEKPMLFISKLTKNDTYYVYSNLYDMIVEIDRSALSFLSWTDNEWITEDMYDTSIGYIDNVKIENGDWWASFDIEMTMKLETKINTGAPSTFLQTLLCSNNRDRHILSLATNINGNTDTPSGNVGIITVEISTLKNYYKYIKEGNKTTGMSADEVKALEEFIDTISEFNYSDKTGELLSLHKVSLTDRIGNVHVVSIVFTYSATGEISAYMQVNNEQSVCVFSLNAYEAYEKIIFSEKVTANEELLAQSFYNSKYTNASATYDFDKITGENSEGETIILTEHKSEKIKPDGTRVTEYFLSNDYRVFFNVDGEDLVGVAHNFVRFYDMSDKDTTTNGAYETIKQFPYEFTATQVRLVVADGNGNTLTIADGTLGDGSFSVKVTEDLVEVTDSNGNVTKYHRFASTSIFSSFYASFMYATYEGICEIPEEQKEAFRTEDKWNARITITTKLSPDENGKCIEYVYKTYQYSERRAYITLNGKGDFFVVRTFLDKIVDSSKQVFDNVLVDSSDRYN